MICRFIKYEATADLIHQGLNPDDVYQTFEYTSIEAGRSDGIPYLFLFESDGLKCALPLLIHKVPHGEIFDKPVFDASSVYGYPGFIFNRTPSGSELKKIFDLLLELTGSENIVSIFIRLHPYYNSFILENSDRITQVVHGKTIFVDLTQSYESISKNYSTNHKRGIKSLVKDGFQITINRWEDYNLFQSAYEETMKLVNAGSFYYFDASYFEQLRNKLNDHLHLISVYDSRGRFASGALFTSYKKIIQYHLGGTMNEFRLRAPSKLVFDAAISYFKKQDFDILHLGGGVGSKDDELFRFKKGFSQNMLDFSTIRCIADRSKYDQLVKAHFGNTLNTDINYFPLYRKQI